MRLLLRTTLRTVTRGMATSASTRSVTVLDSLQAMRAWRRQQQAQGRSVGFVPTMGALHDGHIDLVRRSLAGNDTTVLSIFVNPAQFAPHEDYGTYPKTFEHDMERLRQVLAEFPEKTSSSLASGPSSTFGADIDTEPNNASLNSRAVVFLPSVKDMYPSGIVLDVADQKGTFVEVKGFGHQMEGKTRPTFFRGVATIVTKLFNVVQPTRAYFGQKDIQQALILRRLVRDLLLDHPLPENLIIVPTHRAPLTPPSTLPPPPSPSPSTSTTSAQSAPSIQPPFTGGLALSSRNAYLTPAEASYAPTLYAALRLAQDAWESGSFTAQEAVARAEAHIAQRSAEGKSDGVDVRLDYVTIVDPETFELADWKQRDEPERTALVVGAMFVGRTRLIDNILSGNISGILGGGQKLD